MKTFSKEEYINWFNTQPNDRPIQMGFLSKREGTCGCLAIEFFQDKKIEFNQVNPSGNKAIGKNGNIVAYIEGIEPFGDVLIKCDKSLNSQNFGELRQYYKPQIERDSAK